MFSATEGWLLDLATVWDDGVDVKPRGQATRELVGFRSQVVDMTQPVVTTPERKLGYKFMAAEAAWILSGDDKVATIAPYSKDIVNYSDDGHRFYGAYGPKIMDQVEYVVDSLVRDPDSRQAVLSIWRENPKPSKDVPCTLTEQFLLRDNELHCVATMRSSDLWLGHVYDVFNLSMTAAYVALKLRGRTGRMVELGDLHLTCGSKHVYERNYEGVETVLKATEGRLVDHGPVVDPMGLFTTTDELVRHLWALAESGKVAEQSSWRA